MKKRIVASIEARMGSSRLPGKVMTDVRGKPAIQRLVERLRQSKRLDDIVLATSTAKADDVLADWAKEHAVACFRGSEDDVLNRVVSAHRKMESDLIVEVTGDCTLLDPQVVDWGIETFLNNEVDVVSNTWKLSFPMGIDVQVFPFKLLAEVESRIQDPAVREHVSLYFYEHPEKYRILNLMAPERWTGPTLRFQLDYPEDLQFIRTVYDRLEPKYGPYFSVEEIFSLLRQDPALKAINEHCVEKATR